MGIEKMPRKNQESVIMIKGMHKYYRNDGLSYHALKGIDFEVKKGEFVSVMGPSGSGKSTLLHVMGLFDEFENGEYLLDGVDVKTLDEAEKARIRSSKIGFVFQMFYLVPSLTIRDNIMLPGLLLGRSRDELNIACDSVAKRFGIMDILEKKPNKISGGQMQRAAVARSLINDPAIIFADEPTGNLDSVSGRNVMELFEQLHKEGRTIVLITHDSNVAKRAERTIRILDGEIHESRHKVEEK